MPYMTSGEQHALRRGEVITRRMRRKETGEEFWVEIKRSWDRLYYSCDGCHTWHKTATEAHEASRGAVSP